MKKSVIIIVILFCLLLVVALIATGLVLLFRGVMLADLNGGQVSDWFKSWQNTGIWLPWGSRQTYQIDETRTLSLDGIDVIEIGVISENVRLAAGQQDLIATLSGNYRAGAPLSWAITRQGSKAVLAIDYPVLGLQSSDLALAIAIPASFTGSVTIDTTSSDVDLPDTADYAWKSLTIQSVSGDVAVGAATMQALSVKTVSGQIEAMKINCPVIVESVSGEIDLTWQTVQAAKAKTISGDIDFRLPAEASCELSYETVSGDFDNNDLAWALVSKQNQKTIVRLGAGEQKIAVSTVSGDLQTKIRSSSD